MAITLVALAALAATSAFAQSSVSLYGTLDVVIGNIVYKKNDLMQTTRSGAELNANDSSRWGLTGKEDLGGGMAAEFKIEQGIGTNPRSGLAKDFSNQNGTYSGNAYTLDATVLGDRELWAAISFKTGTRVQAGYGVTALRNLAVQTDAAGSNLSGNPVAHNLGTYRREGLTVVQAFGPVTATVGVSGNKQELNAQGTGTTVTSDNIKVGKGSNFALTYNQGPINAGVAYDVVDTSNPEFAGNSATVNYATGWLLPKVSAADTRTKTTLVAGSYDAGVAKFFLQNYTADVTNNTTATAAGAGKIGGTSVGVTAPFGAVTAFAQSFTGKNKQYATAGTAEDRKYTGYSVGARYNLSKRTYAYAATGQFKVEKGIGVDATEQVTKQTSVGVAHAF